MSRNDEFMDSLVQSIAKEVVQSSIIQHEVARAVKDNPKLVRAIIDNLDQDLFAKYLAGNIMRIGARTSGSNIYSNEVKTIIRDAKKQARIQITADFIEEIRSDTENA